MACFTPYFELKNVKKWYVRYLAELQLNKAFVFILITLFRSRRVHDGIVLSKIYEKRDNFEIIVCFQFLDEDVLRPLLKVYIFRSLFLLKE